MSASFFVVTGDTGTGTGVGDTGTVINPELSVPIFPLVARNLCINPFWPREVGNFRGLRGGVLEI